MVFKRNLVWAIAIPLSAACTSGDALQASVAALSAEQCAFFDVNGEVTVCHETASLNNPYTVLKLSTEACAGHDGHWGDYVTSTNPADATYDPTCNGQGCLPEGAPVDLPTTVMCCEGMLPFYGRCSPLACPANSTQTKAGDGYACACNAGYQGVVTWLPWGPWYGSCSPCPAGTYSNEPGAATCTLCPAGTYAGGGATACAECPAGTYSSAPGAATCTWCPAGTWSDEGATACAPLTCPICITVDPCYPAVCDPNNVAQGCVIVPNPGCLP